MVLRFFVIGCLAFGLAACAAPIQSASSGQTLSASERTNQEQAAGKILDDFHDAAAKADEARYFAHFAEDAIFMGSDATERWTKSEFQTWAKPFFTRGKAWTFHATRRVVHVDEGGAIAWFDEDLTTDGLGPSRGSGVLVMHGGTWRIAHYNLTLTIPNDRLANVRDVVASVVNQPAPKDPLDGLSWMSGGWQIKSTQGETIEETWTTPNGGLLVAMGRTVRPGKSTQHEYLRIEVRGDKIVYLAQPMGQPPTEFVLASSAGKRALFENLANDWPKRIRYERTNKGLAVRLEGAAGQPVEEWTYEPMVIGRGR